MTEWTWTWHPHPEVWVLVATLAIAYVYALRVIGPRFVHPAENTSTRGQRWSFGLGLLTLLVASSYPIHDVAEGSMYSFHMTQHMLISLVAPPLLLAGTPWWLGRWFLTPKPLLRVVRALSRPLAALIVFNVVLVLGHWPAVVNLSVGNELFHFGAHAVVFTAAMIMWMPVFSPLIEIPRLSYPGRMLYLFLQSLVPTVPASFLTFGDAPLYKVYETMPKLWGMSPLDDQRLGGLIMKIVGGFLLWGIITVLFFKWHAEEDREGTDLMQFRDVDRQLNRSPIPIPTRPTRTELAGK